MYEMKSFTFMWEPGWYHKGIVLLVALEAGMPSPSAYCGLLKHLRSVLVASILLLQICH